MGTAGKSIMPKTQGEKFVGMHFYVSNYFAKPYLLPIGIFFPDFKMDLAWMEKKIDSLISMDEIERSVELLTKAGHWYQDEVGKWKARDAFLDTGDSILLKSLMNEHHAETLKKWAEILPEVAPSLREVGLIHIPINHEKIPELKNRIQNFQDEILAGYRRRIMLTR